MVPQASAQGVEVSITSADGWSEKTTTRNGGIDSLTNGSTGGRFGFAGSYEGDYTLSFSLNGSWNSTDVHLGASNGKRCEVVARLLPRGAVVSDVDGAKLRALCDVKRLQAGGPPALVYVSLDGVRETRPEIVWVMETDTDASLLPSGRPDQVFVVPGQGDGDVRVRAHLGSVRSSAAKLSIRTR